MKERGMIFNAEMVRALLDGRKTQTRRPMKSDCMDIGERDDGSRWPWREHNDGGDYWYPCPFGEVGDRIWVRETWSVVSHSFNDGGLMIDYVPDRPAKAVHEQPFGNGYYSGHAIYATDGDFTWGDDDGCVDGRSCWKPSIHMPRWASRITLEITDVRVERLNSISQEDAQAEGMELTGWRPTYSDPDSGGEVWTPYDNFAQLWESIYGEEGWKDNPWVWVIEFKRVKGATA
ncbi:hypothetical protein [Scandinavium sp.]|uniref:hypothetical protein n=1 Tax=Scandinavium sp. TaxID=2830653 RepID=UPI002898EC71|nr:hypothetical protein [Scandinavium sp.]